MIGFPSPVSERLGAVLVVAMLLGLMLGGCSKDNSGVVVLPSTNLFVFSEIDDLEKGANRGTAVVQTKNGEIVLEPNETTGTYTSPQYCTEPFEYLVLSWNANTPEGSYIEVEGRVRVVRQGKNGWSEWLSWGYWSTTTFIAPDGKVSLAGSAPSGRAEDALAKIATDELFVRGSNKETADRFQYRVTLHRGSGGAPVVTLVAATIRNTLSGQALSRLWEDEVPKLWAFDAELDVPTYSQYLRHYTIANSICSPTSVAMALGYHGVDLSPEEAAWGVRDYKGNMFGNWSFNAAYAGAQGMTSYVAYATEAPGADPWYSVKREIDQGNPVVVSVHYRKPGYAGRSEPAVENVPINYTPGHLVLIRGFTFKDDRQYVIVNDSAAASDDEVRRLYPADQFLKAWAKRLMYVITPGEDDAPEPCASLYVDGVLEPVGEIENNVQKYRFLLGDQEIDLGAANMRSVVVSFLGGKTTPINPRPIGMNESELLWFNTRSPAGEYKYWFIAQDQRIYTATLLWTEP